MRNITNITAFEDVFEVFEMPAVRLIGQQTRNGGALGNTAPALWDKLYKTGALDLLQALPAVISAAMFGWTSDYNPETKTHIYTVCAMTPANTAIPKGFIHIDLPACTVAKGLFGEDVAQTAAHAAKAGYTPDWEHNPWNAELSLMDEDTNPPKTDCAPWHWLVPVCKSYY